MRRTAHVSIAKSKQIISAKHSLPVCSSRCTDLAPKHSPHKAIVTLSLSVAETRSIANERQVQIEQERCGPGRERWATRRMEWVLL